MADLSTISPTQPQISAVDALWTLFQAQNKSVRKAFAQRLLKEMAQSKHKKKTKVIATEISQLDSILYGSIQLPADFNYEKELEKTLDSKYPF